MDAKPHSELTIGDMLPWVKLTMDYSDQLADAIPEDQLDWRPGDPGGKWSFSLVELVKHIGDARVMYASQLDSRDVASLYWSDGPGEDGVWSFADHKDKAEVLARLAEARRLVEHWLQQPASMLLEVTENSRSVFMQNLAQMREAGHPAGEWERRGPANVNRVLTALAVHEAGHRGTLQALLRLKGINVSGPM